MTILPVGTILHLRSGYTFDHSNMHGTWKMVDEIPTPIGIVELWERIG